MCLIPLIIDNWNISKYLIRNIVCIWNVWVSVFRVFVKFNLNFSSNSCILWFMFTLTLTRFGRQSEEVNFSKLKGLISPNN